MYLSIMLFTFTVGISPRSCSQFLFFLFFSLHFLSAPLFFILSLYNLSPSVLFHSLSSFIFQNKT
jgi:hypothetical protein